MVGGVTSPSCDDERIGSVEARDLVSEDLTVYLTDEQSDWDDFWDGEPFENRQAWGAQWR